jgi:hypothetical protein
MKESTTTSLPTLLMVGLLPDRTLYVIASPWRWLMAGGQVAALAGMADEDTDGQD